MHVHCVVESGLNVLKMSLIEVSCEERVEERLFDWTMLYRNPHSVPAVPVEGKLTY